MSEVQSRLLAAPEVLAAVTAANDRPDSGLVSRPRRPRRGTSGHVARMSAGGDLYAPEAEQQRDELAGGPDVDLYAAVLDAIDHVLDRTECVATGLALAA